MNLKNEILEKRKKLEKIRKNDKNLKNMKNIDYLDLKHFVDNLLESTLIDYKKITEETVEKESIQEKEIILLKTEEKQEEITKTIQQITPRVDSYEKEIQTNFEEFEEIEEILIKKPEILIKKSLENHQKSSKNDNDSIKTKKIITSFELEEINASEEFSNFINKSSKVIEFILTNEISIKDYSQDFQEDSLKNSTEKDGLISLQQSFYESK